MVSSDARPCPKAPEQQWRSSSSWWQHSGGQRFKSKSVKRSFNDLRTDCRGWSRIESPNRRSWTQHCSDQVARRDLKTGVSSTHTARCDASALRSVTHRVSRIASPRRQDGGGKGRVPQEAREIHFRPFTRHARGVGAKCCVVFASSKRQICSDGDIDRSRTDRRWKLASFSNCGFCSGLWDSEATVVQMMSCVG